MIRQGLHRGDEEVSLPAASAFAVAAEGLTADLHLL